MNSPTLTETYHANLKIIDQLRRELFSGRFRPLIYTTERHSRIRELQRQNAEIIRTMRSQQPRLPGIK